MSYAGEPDDDSGSFFAVQGQLTPDSIQRQLALAAALQQQSQHINPGAYGGLNSAIQNIGGAILGRQAQNQQAQRYAQLLQATLGSPQTTDSVTAPTIGAPTVTGTVGQGAPAANGRIAPPPVNLTATPNITQASAPTQTTGYSGPLGQSLGANAPLYDALLHNMGSQQGTQLLGNLAARQMQHVHTLTPDEVQAAGLPAGGVYQSDSLGNIRTVEGSKLMSPAEIAQHEQLLRDTGNIAAQAPLTREQIEQNRLKEREIGATGWTVVNDNHGNPYRYNARTGQATTLDGRSVVSPSGYAKIGTANQYGLPPTLQAALDKGVQEGRVDPTRLTRGNAQIIASTLANNPNADLINLHAYGQQMSNAQLQNRAQQTMRIPGMLQTVADSGKALGYSDAQFIGKLQQFKNGQLNDPAFVRYMTQRNDALLSMAGAMRGNGATDLATQLEEEAARPTMSPAAIDAWRQAHMDVLQPMVDFYKNYAITNPHTGQPVNTNPNSAPHAGTKPTVSNW